MRRILLFVGCAYAAVRVHFGQATEFGVEQLPENENTDRVTFFAAMRQDMDDLHGDYILSFGPPSCEQNCAQSRQLCGEQASTNGNWEHIQLDHYPSPTDPAAIYIRQTIALDSELPCHNSDLLKIDNEDQSVDFTGNLYLSVSTGCIETCPMFETIEIFPFALHRTAENISGLDYKLRNYEFNAEATRNLRIENLGLFVEISTELIDYDYTGEGLPSYFDDAIIENQDCVPELKIVGLTNCSETAGDTCNQRFYLLPVSTDDHALEKVSGRVAIQTKLRSGDGNLSSVTIIHVSLDIDSPTDFGPEKRDIDSMFVLNAIPFFNENLLDNSTTLVDKDQFCISLSSPVLNEVSIVSVRTCGSESVSNLESCDVMNLDDLRISNLYDAENKVTNRKTIAELTPDLLQSQAQVCFKMQKVVSGSQLLEVAYNSSGNLVRRGLFCCGNVTPSPIYCDCPLGYTWDYVCGCCNYHGGWTWSWWWIVVFLILIGGGILAFTVWGGNCGSGHYDGVYLEPTGIPSTYFLVDKDEKKTIVNVHGNNNTTTVTRHSTRVKSRVPTIDLPQ